MEYLQTYGAPAEVAVIEFGTSCSVQKWQKETTQFALLCD